MNERHQMKLGIDTLVFIGPHGSGKTTLGKKVAELLGWQYHGEIGKMLRIAALQQSGANHALATQEGFDREVFLRELARDRFDRGLRVVETWHTGNLAYAEMRSPEVATKLGRVACKHTGECKSRILVQPLRMKRVTALERLSEPGPNPDELVDFFMRVAERTEALTMAWGLNMLPPLYTDCGTPREQASAIVRAFREVIASAS
jgi:ABC-type cobalamin/Fe3+-siderophores transport system ATPase subunit